MTTVSSGSLAVGQDHISDTCTVEEVLTLSGVTLPMGLSSAGCIAAELLSPPVPAAILSRVEWSAARPVGPTDLVRAEVVVTSVTADGVERSVHLVDESGRVREHGTQVWTLESPESAPVSPAINFCTIAWGQALADSLADDKAFASSLATWDGTIGLRCGLREVHLRIYRGHVIDVTRRAPHGATFTFIASPRTWTELALHPVNNFMRRAIAGEFSSAGDGYEYLRLTKPLNILMDHVRTIAQEARS